MTDRESGSRLQAARVMAMSLLGGVMAIWVVCWMMTASRGEGLAAGAGLSPRLAFWIWAAVAVSGLAGALAFKSRALRVSRRADFGQVQTNLLVAWALVESPAVLGAVIFLLLADAQILITALPVYLLGFAATFPRAAWFRPRSPVREWQ